METQAPQERQSQETRALRQGVTKKPGRGSASLVPLLRHSGSQSRTLTHVTSSSYTRRTGLGREVPEKAIGAQGRVQGVSGPWPACEAPGAGLAPGALQATAAASRMVAVAPPLDTPTGSQLSRLPTN